LLPGWFVAWYHDCFLENKSPGLDESDFLSNLDYLHQHLHDTWELASFPHFSCTRLADGNLHLDYQSTRGSLLAPFVQGLVSAVADELFHTPIEISLASTNEKGARFRISFVGKGDGAEPIRQAALAAGEKPATDTAAVAADSLAAAGIPMSFFLSLWPFFVLTDAQMAVIAVGPALAERLPAAAPGAQFHDTFAVERPEAARDATYAVLHEHANVAFRVVSREAVAGGRPLALRGGVHLLPGPQCLWLLTPVMLKLEDMHVARLSLHDLPLHDAARDLLFMSESNATQNGLLIRLERLSAELAHEQARSDDLLFSMLPSSVLDDLREGRKVRARDHDSITILFSDIVGFTDMGGRTDSCCAFGCVALAIAIVELTGRALLE
jgi:guanylate cyclase soluble subunit beta